MTFFIGGRTKNEQKEVNLSYYDFDEIYIKVYSAFGYYNQEEGYVLQWN